jgi:hypothetical protein
MSKWFTFTPEQEADWLAWVAARPPHVRKVAERFRPTTLYRLNHGKRSRDDARTDCGESPVEPEKI